MTKLASIQMTCSAEKCVGPVDTVSACPGTWVANIPSRLLQVLLGFPNPNWTTCNVNIQIVVFANIGQQPINF